MWCQLTNSLLLLLLLLLLVTGTAAASATSHSTTWCQLTTVTAAAAAAAGNRYCGCQRDLTLDHVVPADQFAAAAAAAAGNRYCGCQRDLTLDHVVPVSMGGGNSWANLVTACMACNQRKGNKSLAQLGWSLPCMPREPTPQEVGVIAGISKVRRMRRRNRTSLCHRIPDAVYQSMDFGNTRKLPLRQGFCQ
jgi:hypothetical protein